MSHLKLLLGRKVESVSDEIGQTIEINSGRNELPNIDLYVQFCFDKFSLSIYNKYKVEGLKSNTLKELCGHELVDVFEQEKIMNFIFDSGVKIMVDLKPEGYLGPEAMVLEGPNNLIVVWN